MAQYSEFTRNLGRGLTRGIRRVQEAQVRAIRSANKSVGRFVPDLTRLPLARRLPNPREFVEANFDLAERLLEAQRDYTLAVLDAAARPKPKSRRRKPRKRGNGRLRPVEGQPAPTVGNATAP